MKIQQPELLLQASNEAIFIIHGEAIASCNDAASEMFGYAKKELIGMPPETLFVTESNENIHNYFRNGNPKLFECTAITGKHEAFDAQIQIKTIKTFSHSFVTFTVRNISDFKKSQNLLLAKDALLESVSFAAAKFLESKNWRQEINVVLRHIGQSAGVSRVYIFQNFEDDTGKEYMCQKYEWVAPDIEPQIDNPLLQKLYYDENGLGRIQNLLSKGEAITGHVRNFPQSEQEVLLAQGIQSIVLTPIFLNTQWWGFIGYDECAYERIWNQNEIRLLSTVADIFNSALEQEKMELDMSWINQNFRSLFDNSPDAIFVYNYQGYVIDANDSACQLNGLTKEQLINRHVAELVPDEEAKKASEDFRFWTNGEINFMESNSINSTGTKIPVEIRSTRILYFDVPAVVLFVRDISRCKNAETLLKNRLEFIQFISQISSEFIKIDTASIGGAINKALGFVCRFTGNERGYVFLANSSNTLLVLSNEYCEENVITHKGNFDSFRISDFPEFMNTLTRGEHILVHRDEIANTHINPKIWEILETLNIKSLINIPLIVGERFLGFIGFDSTSSRANWDKETIHAFMLAGQIIANVIIRKKSEDEIILAKEKAEQSDQLKTAFLGQMSHEMRTPLNSIIGFADFLVKDLDREDLQEMADFILKSGNRLLNTFNLIIDLSEIEAHVMTAHLDVVNLNQMVENMMPTFSSRSSQKGLEFKFSESDSDVHIMADENLLEKIINNLVDNALKYTRDGSIWLKVFIEDADTRPMAVISVKDTGIGIQTDKLDHIFSNFRQASEGYNREFEGSGLGLSVARGMVQLMDGEIAVNSEINVGSEFRIKFPLFKVMTSEEQKLTENSTIGHIPKKRPGILVIEDELVHQKYLEYILKDGYELCYAENGFKALELANTTQFDLIILDINLGKDLNGIEVLSQIRKIKGYEETAVIAATANVMKGHKELFLSSGFTHYIPKPFKADKMRTLVDEIFNICKDY
ncbi:MAG: PAS domain S-box protein [Bacteroidales bacterium]|nr:PAS domain S-box protein [Bacteroidales bacterium]